MHPEKSRAQSTFCSHVSTRAPQFWARHGYGREYLKFIKAPPSEAPRECTVHGVCGSLWVNLRGVRVDCLTGNHVRRDRGAQPLSHNRSRRGMTARLMHETRSRHIAFLPLPVPLAVMSTQHCSSDHTLPAGRSPRSLRLTA